ncbi:MAG: DUF4339 domain-containing protein [Verrucomicrobiales bacterium]|nr:DUF4339 domain-containing protein [Verrucomicrobiales bacterium]
MADEPRKIHITRKGQQFGPYPEDIAKQYLDEGTLLKTDLAWHDGAEGWEPLGKLLAAEEETKTDEPPPPPAPAATAPPEIKSIAQPTGFATYSPYDEETQKSTQFMTLGILAIVGVVLPTVIFSPSFKIHFPNFDLGGKSAENIITMIGPLIVGITLAAMAKTAKDPMRCSVALGLSLVLLIILFSIEGGGVAASSFQGQPIVFFIGLTALLMGCYARHYRPSNLPAYIIAVVGGGFLVLSCLVPAKGQSVPLIDTFKAFKGSAIMGLAMMAGLGSKITASYICFVTTREKSSHTVAAKSDLSIKLLIGGIILAHAILLLGGFINAFKGDGDFGLKLSSCVTLTIELIKNLTHDGGLYLVPALAGSCLLISCTAKARGNSTGWDTQDTWQ